MLAHRSNDCTEFVHGDGGRTNGKLRERRRETHRSRERRRQHSIQSMQTAHAITEQIQSAVAQPDMSVKVFTECADVASQTGVGDSGQPTPGGESLNSRVDTAHAAHCTGP